MRRLLASLAASALLVLPAMPAGAIVDGEPDGDGHPMVGALVTEFEGEKDWFCSGTLVSDTVFLTAGHCTAWLAEDQEIWVTFESVFDAGGPFYLGTPFTHPDYNPRTLANDVAVVVLDEPFELDDYAEIPSAGLLTDMKRDKTIDDELYLNVGYGGVVDFPPGPPIVSYDGIRRVSESPYGGLTKNNLHLQSNGRATGGGGTCFGDSGGPHFFGDSSLLVSVTSWGDAVCRSLDMTQRVDIPSVLEFLEDHGVTPAA